MSKVRQICIKRPDLSFFVTEGMKHSIRGLNIRFRKQVDEELSRKLWIV